VKKTRTAFHGGHLDEEALRTTAGAGIATQQVKSYVNGRINGSPPSHFQKMPNELQHQTFSGPVSRRDLNSVEAAYSGDARLRDNVEYAKKGKAPEQGHLGDMVADAAITKMSGY
jgi:hypothetical protein